MKKNIQMPKLSEQMETAVLAAWNKEAGDMVKKGDVLFEIETEKVVSEVESMESGVLEEIFFEAGDEIKVDEIIAVINCD
ncbi:MAG: biotin/lipoyl-binding protein [Acetobacterium sp.]|nr:biotin/lipoyl-containing protein [uncultured Acetobacterium sp.]MBU4439769.1 biotin/lipoyl-binding protein [Bacillota bacterium]MCG2728821.1 biotin/lipoyl-binding protein [Acetobacterium sp.]